MDIDDIHSCAICGKTVPTFYDAQNDIWRCESEATCLGELSDTVQSGYGTAMSENLKDALNDLASEVSSVTDIDKD